MKKQAYVIIALTSVLFVLFFSHSLLEILNFDWSIFLHDVEKTEKFIFLLLVFSMSMTFLLALFWRGIEELSLRKMQANLKRLLAGKEVIQLADPDLDASFKSLSGKLNLLTEALQKAENNSLSREEEIIEKERKRIARDLHDTVSQELFAAHMILLGVSQQSLKLDREKMQTQLQSVTAILETAQKDLRVLLLHLRPVELEQKSLVEGIQILLKELEDKSDLRVSLKQNVTQLPKKIEEHIFRILQELISNTLRHAQASCLDVYLYQTDLELQLKVVDNGIGFKLGSLDDLSYGLRNIKERVEDMAGTVQLLTAPKQGLAVDIRIPLLDKELKGVKMKILLVDDHEMVRLGLKSYFDLQDDVEVVGEASNGAQGIDLALELRPDVIVMDIVMPEMNGIEATLAILKEWPEAKILIVTSYLDNEKIMPVLDAGARGYMLKTSSADELLHAVRKVAAGELAIEQEVSKKVEYHRNHIELHEDLTARERDVLKLIAKGYENQRIADELFISLKTVKTHVSNILAKLEVSDRTQAAVYAFQHHLVGHEDF